MRIPGGRTVVAAAILTLVVGAGWVASTAGDDPRSPVDRAWSVLPHGTHTATLIDWSQVSAVLADEDADDLVNWRRAASARDLVQQSVLLNHEERIVDAFGWSPRDLAFEAYGQSDEGALLVVGLAGSPDDGVTWVQFAAGFRELGYRLDDGVWSIDANEFDVRAPGTPEPLRNVAHLPDLGLVVAADRAEYVRESLAVVSGDAPALTDRPEIHQTLDPLRTSTAASVRQADIACETLSLDPLTADERARVRADAPADLERYEALAFGVRDAGEAQTLTAVLAFGDEATATRQLQARRDLFTGETLGRTQRLGALVHDPRSATLGAASVFTFEVGDPTERAFAELTRGVQPAVACAIPRDRG